MPQHANSLLILPGHAIYLDGRWYGGERGGDEAALAEVFAGHATDACRIYREEQYGSLCLSGGVSRPRDPTAKIRCLSEGKSLYNYLREHADALGSAEIDIIREELARDSFENVLFSLLAYYQQKKRWPERIGVVSWKYKALRFYATAVGLDIADRFCFYGSGDPVGREAASNVIEREAHNLAALVTPDNILVDPLCRAEWFQDKRNQRMPVTLYNQLYCACLKKIYRDSAAVIDMVERSTVGQWQNLSWPWSTL